MLLEEISAQQAMRINTDEDEILTPDIDPDELPNLQWMKTSVSGGAANNPLD